MGIIQDLARFNRRIFTSWSFIENRKLLLLWCNAISIFFILSLVNSVYNIFALVLALVFLVIEVGEFLSKKKPKLESETKANDKVKIFKIGNRVFTTWKSPKKDDEPNK